MRERILVVDDEPEIADLIELYLKNENYDVIKCYSGDDALQQVASHPPDLALLDVMLPGISGLQLCQTIRTAHSFPIIMLTARDAEIDKITGLTLGADDYVTKPFRPLELVARVKAQLRRYKKYSPHPTQARNGDVMEFGGLTINIATHEVFLDKKPLALTPTEFAILRVLCENGNTVVSAERLTQEIWGDAYFNKNNNTITVHIRHLREKLGETPDNTRYIKTVWGVGYRFEK